MIDNLYNAVIFNLNHCVQVFPLDLCRIVFNKPLLFANGFFLKIISSISPENAFNFIESPFKQILTIILYLTIFIFLFWILKPKKLQLDLKFSQSAFLGIFIMAILIGSFFRLYNLRKIPSGFTIDEVSIGYNAFAIEKIGKDEYGKKYPLTHFESVGDYKLPAYVYAVSLSQKFIKDKIVSERLPSAIAGILTIVSVFFLGKIMFDKYVGLFASLFFSFSPWGIYHSRLGIETNFGLLFSVLTILFLFLSLNKSYKLLFAAIFFILAIYSHHSYWLFLPSIVFIFLLIYRKIIKVKPYLIISFLIIVFSLLPFALEKNGFRNARFNQTIFAKSQNFDAKTQILNQYVRSFSFITWYGPSAFDLVDVVPNRGLFYPFEFFLLVAGIIILANMEKKKKVFLFSWLILYPLPLLVTKDISAARMYQLLPVPQIIEALTLVFIFKKTKLLIAPFLIILLLSLISYSSDFFSTSPFLYSRYTNYGQIAVINYLKGKYNKFFIEEPLLDKHYLYYFFDQLPIPEHRKKSQRGVLVASVNNLNIVERGYLPQNVPQNIMISFPEDIPFNYKKIGYIKLMDGSSYAVISIPKAGE